MVSVSHMDCIAKQKDTFRHGQWHSCGYFDACELPACFGLVVPIHSYYNYSAWTNPHYIAAALLAKGPAIMPFIYRALAVDTSTASAWSR